MIPRLLRRTLSTAHLFVLYVGSRRKVTRLVREGREVFLDLGSGDRKGHGKWLTVDQTRNSDIVWDLRKGIPFPDESVSGVYSSHFLEHLTFREGQRFLDECLRVLTPGGLFSICVPNVRVYLDAYLDEAADHREYFRYRVAYNCTTRIDYLNYIAYMNGNHKYLFDKENLLYLLRAKGLRNVRERDFDPGLDIERRDFESIYAEAEK